MDKLGELQEKLIENEKLIKQYEGLPQMNYYETLKRQIVAEINKLSSITKDYTEYNKNKIYKDENRSLNPSLSIALTVFVDGAKVELKKDEYFKFDDQGNLVVAREIPNEKKISELKASIVRVRTDLTKSEETPNQASDEVELIKKQSYQNYLRKKLKKFQKELKKTKNVNSLFYVPLAKLSKEPNFVMFAEDYLGSYRSITNVEENIDILLALLFEQKRKIYLKDFGKNFNVLTFSWKKREFPPFGYQVSRGAVEIRRLPPLPVLPDALPIAGQVPSTPVPSTPVPSTPSAANTWQETKKQLLEEIKDLENEMESMFLGIPLPQSGGGIFSDVTSAIANGVKNLNPLGAVENFAASLDKTLIEASKAQTMPESLLANNLQTFGAEVALNYTNFWSNLNETKPRDALVTAVQKYKNSIDLNSHTVFKFPSFLYPDPKLMNFPFIYEYLAYRVSIYHPWFQTEPTLLESLNPLRPALKKNTTLLRNLVPFSPTMPLRDMTIKLLSKWNKYEINEEFEHIKAQHNKQMMHFKMLKLDIDRKLFLFNPAFNYIMIEIVLKEIFRCSKKEKLINCIEETHKRLLNNKPSYTRTKRDHVLKQIRNCNTESTTLKPPLLFQHNPSPTNLTVNGSLVRDNESPIGNLILNAPTEGSAINDSFLNILQNKLDSYKGNQKINLVVSFNHELPESCQCMYDMKEVLLHNKSVNLMKEVEFKWDKQLAQINEWNNQLYQDKLNTECFNKIKTIVQSSEGANLNIECASMLNDMLVKVDGMAREVLNYLAVDDANKELFGMEEKYTLYYEELNNLNDYYKELFKTYQKTLVDLIQLLVSLRSSNDSYDRKIAQMDYAADAYQNLLQISIPLQEIAIKPRPETEINDYNKIISNLATLCDLLQGKMFRGVVYNGFPQKQITSERDDAQEEILKRVINYEDDVYEKEVTTRLTKIEEFTKDYADLKPEYVLSKNMTLMVPETVGELYQKALGYSKIGQFLNAINACYLALVMPVRIYDTINDLYIKVKSLLTKLLLLTGKNPELVRALPSKPDESTRLRIMVRFQGSTNEENLANLVYQTLEHSKNNKRNLAHYIASKFKYATDEKNLKKAQLNYLCLKFYLGKKTTRDIFKLLNSANDFKTILPFFPENHIGKVIVGNIKDALVVSKEGVYDYIAQFLMNYKIKRRAALDELKESAESKRVKRDIAPIVTSIKDALRDLKYVGYVNESVESERESDWPKRGAGSTFFRSVKYPYVDGNYNINVMVDLMLTKLDVTNLKDLSCEQKVILAKDVTKSLF